MSPGRNRLLHTCHKQQWTSYFIPVFGCWTRTATFWGPSLLVLRNRLYLLGFCSSVTTSGNKPLPFPNDSVSEEVVIWPLWAPITDLDVWLGGGSALLAPGSWTACVCGCGGRWGAVGGYARIRARWTVCVRGVYVCADTKALTRRNRSSAQV